MFLSQHIAVFLLWLCLAILSVHGNPWGWGPGSNSDHPAGGPAWNGGDQSTDNIIIHQKDNGGNGNWHY